MSEAPTSGPIAEKPRGLRAHLLTLLILVACCVAVLWAARAAWRSNLPPTVEDWARAIQSGDTNERREAALKLAEAGPQDLRTVAPALIGALGDESTAVRAAAADALIRCISTAERALGEDADGPARDAVAALLRVAAHDSEPEVRGLAIQGSSAIFRAVMGEEEPDGYELEDPIGVESLVATYVDVLSHDAALRVAAAQALGDVGPWAKSAPRALIEAMKDDQVAVRTTAALAVARFRTGVDPAIPLLLHGLKHEDATGGIRQAGSPRRKFATALATIRPSAESAPELIAALDTTDRQALRSVATAVGTIGPAASSALPILAKALDQSKPPEGADASDEDTLAVALAGAIAKVGPPEEAVRALTAALKSPLATTRHAATDALGEMGPRAVAAIPDLVAALERSLAGDPPSEDAITFAQTIGRVAPDEAACERAVALLEEATRSKEERTRALAARSLGALGRKASRAIPTLEALKDDREESVRSTAKRAVDRINAPPETTPSKKSRPVAPSVPRAD
jgi:HEAT repeat protein